MRPLGYELTGPSFASPRGSQTCRSRLIDCLDTTARSAPSPRLRPVSFTNPFTTLTPTSAQSAGNDARQATTDTEAMLPGVGALFDAVTEVLIDVAPVLEFPSPDGFTDAVQQLAHEVVNEPVTDCVVDHPMDPRAGLQNSTAYECCPSANLWRHCWPQSMPPTSRNCAYLPASSGYPVVVDV
jgi:hypothetical protein